MPTLNFNSNIIEVQRQKRKGPFPVNVQFLIVGGGGGSWTKTGNDTVGGGGAGGYITGSYCFLPGETQTFTIGAAGASGASPTNGSNTNAFSQTAIGGGRAGARISGFETSPNSGGSGGGGISGTGSGTFPQGFAGGLAGAPNFGGGGGGGAANSGSTSTSNTGGNGGDGKQWLDGVYYAGGGAGSNYEGSSAPFGTPGLGNAIGGGASPNGNATAGIVAVRYQDGEIFQVTNGTTVAVGGYTYHYFNSGTGSLKLIGDEQQDPTNNPCPV